MSISRKFSTFVLAISLISVGSPAMAKQATPAPTRNLHSHKAQPAPIAKPGKIKLPISGCVKYYCPIKGNR